MSISISTVFMSRPGGYDCERFTDPEEAQSFAMQLVRSGLWADVEVEHAELAITFPK